MPKISVILPVYNVEKYINKCIESLLAQTLKDVEFIFVDDCSPDNCAEIIKSYNDTRIKLIRHPVNKYTAEARNTGMDNATGEYISFIDPDDYIAPDFLEKLYKLAKAKDADIAKGVYVTIPDNKLHNTNKAIEKNKYNFHFQMITAIYKRSLITKNKIRFSIDTICGQFPMIHFAKKIVTCDDAIYYYVQHDNSCVNCVFSSEKWKKLNIAGARIILNYLNKFNVPRNSYILVASGLVLRLYQYGYDRMSEEDKLKYKAELNMYLDEFYKNCKYIKDSKILNEYNKVRKKYE